MADNSTKIEQINKILENGIDSTSTDGQSTKFRSVDELREIRNDLERRDTTRRHKKPRVSTIRLSGF